MADIKELGESLLARTRQRQDDIYKKQRKEAYKIALMQGGVSLMNNALMSKTQDFLTNEQAMAARIKQARGVADAEFFVNEYDRVQAGGLDPVEFYSKELMPTYQALAMEQLKEQNYDPDTINAYVRSQVRPLAQKKWEQIEAGYTNAASLTSPEDFATMQALKASRPQAPFQAITSAIGRRFSGKTKEQADQEVLDSILNDPQIQLAETVTAAKRAFTQTGNLAVALDVAGAIERGEIKEAEKIRTWRRVGDVHKTKGMWGEEASYSLWEATDGDGNLILGDDGNPILRQIGINGSFDRLPVRLSTMIDSLSDGERATMRDSFTAVSSIATPEEKDRWEAYVNKFAVKDGTPNPEMPLVAAAAYAKKAQVDLRLDQQDAEAIMTRVMYNRLNETYGNEVETKPGWFGTGLFRKTEPDFNRAEFTEEPSGLEMITALGDLEGTAYAANFNEQQLMSMAANMAEEFTSLSPEKRGAILAKFSDNSKYSFLHYTNEMGESVFDVLNSIDQMLTPPPPPKSQFASAEAEVPEISESRAEEIFPHRTYKELEANPQFQEDARVYLEFLNQQGADPIETLRDELNKPVVEMWRTGNLDNHPEAKEARERLLYNLQGTQAGSLEEWASIFKDHTGDFFSDPAHLLLLGALGKIKKPVNSALRVVDDIRGVFNGRIQQGGSVVRRGQGYTPTPQRVLPDSSKSVMTYE